MITNRRISSLWPGHLWIGMIWIEKCRRRRRRLLTTTRTEATHRNAMRPFRHYLIGLAGGS